MTTPTTMEERFDELLPKELNAYFCICSVTGDRVERNPVFLADCLCHRISCLETKIKSFIQSEIDLAVEKREKEIVEVATAYKNPTISTEIG